MATKQSIFVCRLVFTGLPELFDRGFNRDTLLLAIMQKIFLRLPPPQCQREVQLVVEKCTNFDRCHRPKASEVLEELRKIEMFCSYIKYFDFSPKIDEVQMKIVKPFTSCDSSTISDPDNSLEDSLSPPKVHLEDREIDFLSPPINASFLVLSEVKEVDLQKSVDNNGDADGDLEISVTEKDPLNGETALEIEERKKSHICFFGSIFVFLLVALLFFYISSFAFSEKKQIEEPNSDLLIHSNGTGKNPLYASNTYFDRPKELPEKLSDLFVKNVDTVCLKLDSYRPMESADFEPTFSVEIKFDDIDLVFSIYNGTTYLYANGEHQRNISTREAWQLWNLVEAPELLELNLNFVMGSEIKKTYQQTVALVRKLLGNAIFLPQMKTVPRLMFSANRSEILEIFLNNFHANVTEKATLEISVGMEEENSFKSQMIALMGVLSTCRIIELNGNLLERWDVLANSNALLTIQTESSMSNYLSTVSRLLLDGPPSKNPNSVAILRFYFPIPKNVHVEKAFLARTLEIENSLKKTSASLITNETTATRLYAQFFQNGFDAEIEKIRKEATQYKKMQIFLVKLGDEQDLVIFVETLNLLRGGKQWHFACQILGKFK
ncbi:unnamed protein product, partial [Mesorhabditis belari]|uniref:Uncharacterized protein n=1 Tax=Mesorhabditis belari TaxID=2138241 RepID=A0AAF3J1Z2_9BILA